jgi:CspA family cold shock protein
MVTAPASGYATANPERNHMATGKLKMFNLERGFGFVTDDAGGPDQFIHITALERSGLNPEDLPIGMRLSYQIENTRAGRYAAADVKLV